MRPAPAPGWQGPAVVFHATCGAGRGAARLRRPGGRRHAAPAQPAAGAAAGRLERRLMDRLMVAQLESVGCSAELMLNGMPVAALPPSGGSCCLAVHEYTLAGRNQVS